MTAGANDNDSGAKATAAGRGGRCPICRNPTLAVHRPFCSARCADVDLGRWLGNGYAIPGDANDDEDGSLTPVPDAGTGTGGERDG